MLRRTSAHAALVLVLLSSVQAQQHPDEGPDLRDPTTIAAGAKLYAAACSACHGKTGEGGRGPNLNDGMLVRRTNNIRLFGVIKNGVPGSDMPAFPIGDAKIWQVVAYLRNLSAPAIDANVPGDVDAGRALFFGKAGCTNCHAIRGEGGMLGPDLTEAGATRSTKQLREAILEPSARIAEGYRPVRVVTAKGEKLEGVARNYTNYSLQMIDKTGKLHLFDTRELKQMEIDNSRSPMPADYATKLSATEVDNIIAFLARQSARSTRPKLPMQTTRRSR